MKAVCFAALAGVAAGVAAQTATITIDATRRFVTQGESVQYLVSITGDLGVYGFNLAAINAPGFDFFTGFNVVGGDDGSNNDIFNPATLVDDVITNPDGTRGSVLPSPFNNGDNLNVELTADPFNNVGPAIIPDLTTGGVNTLMFTFTAKTLDLFIGTITPGVADSQLFPAGAVQYATGLDPLGLVWETADYENVEIVLTRRANTVVTVPTPGAAAVLGLGGLAAMRRRR